MSAIKGRAFIHTMKEIAPDGAKIPVSGEISGNWIDMQDQFDLWSNYLLLPKNYTVVGVYFDVLYQMWAIVIESEKIPLPPQGQMIPRLKTTYYANHDPITNTHTVSLSIDGFEVYS